MKNSKPTKKEVKVCNCDKTQCVKQFNNGNYCKNGKHVVDLQLSY